MKKPKLSVGWVVLWLILFWPAALVYVVIHYVQLKEYEVYHGKR